MSDFLGKYANDFEDVFEVAETKFGKIYQAYNKKYKRCCHLKTFEKEKLQQGDYDFLIQKVQSEEQITKLCKCENVIELYQKLEVDDKIIFELEYCEKDINAAIIDNYGGMQGDKEFFRKIVIDIAKALKKLHECGVMHRDIKPSNIFLNNTDKNEGERIAKLGDFGCSIFIQDNMSDPIGTILYSSPEIHKNIDYNEKCDLWSLGITLHELFFGIPPYGPNYNINIIKECLFADKFLIKKTNFPSFDILLRKLLTVKEEQRISFEEFFQIVFDENFLKDEEKFLKSKPQYKSLYEEILKAEEPIFPDTGILESDNPLEQNEINKKQIVTLVKGGHFPDIMNIPNGSTNEGEEVFNNIIYYDENKDFRENVYKDSDFFERITPGAFILCSDMESLELIKDEVVKQYKREKKTIFNLITTGSTCDKIMEYLNKNKDLKNCIANACVFCFNLGTWSKLLNKYNNILRGVYNIQTQVAEFIKKYSSKDIKPFPLTKLITLADYNNKYKDRHKKISEFYGNMSVEDYKKHLEEMKKLIKTEAEKNALKKQQNVLLGGFMTFEIKNDLALLNKLIIKEYTKETFYGDLNRWLMNSKMNSYDTIAYFTSRLMYSLNNYGKENKMYYDKDNTTLRRGIKIPYSCLLPYIRAVGKVILLSSFTSTSENEITARNFSGRDVAEKQYKKNNIFSVIYIIHNNYKNNWVSNGINVQNESAYKSEKEILYQPFSFYLVKKVNIDIKNYIADIYLETVGKKEILEEKIKKGKSIEYNKSAQIMEVKN